MKTDVPWLIFDGSLTTSQAFFHNVLMALVSTDHAFKMQDLQVELSALIC